MLPRWGFEPRPTSNVSPPRLVWDISPAWQLSCVRLCQRRIPLRELEHISARLCITHQFPWLKLMGGRIPALPTRPAHNTVQLTSLPKLQESYDCTLSNSLVPFPLWWRDIQPHPYSNRRQSKIKIVSKNFIYTNRVLAVRQAFSQLFLSIIFSLFWATMDFVNHSWAANFFVNQLGYIMSDKEGNCFGAQHGIRALSSLKFSCLPPISPVWNSSILRNLFGPWVKKTWQAGPGGGPSR